MMLFVRLSDLQSKKLFCHSFDTFLKRILQKIFQLCVCIVSQYLLKTRSKSYVITFSVIDSRWKSHWTQRNNSEAIKMSPDRIFPCTKKKMRCLLTYQSVLAPWIPIHSRHEQIKVCPELFLANRSFRSPELLSFWVQFLLFANVNIYVILILVI